MSIFIENDYAGLKIDLTLFSFGHLGGQLKKNGSTHTFTFYDKCFTSQT